LSASVKWVTAVDGRARMGRWRWKGLQID
jgi:hypothetical protein